MVERKRTSDQPVNSDVEGDDQAAADEELPQLTPKDVANAKQRQLEAVNAEQARKVEAGEIEPELDHGRKVKVVDGRRFVLVNGGWIESGEG